MTDLSELWKTEQGNGQIVVGKKVEKAPWQTVEFDLEAAQELYGELAGSALADYLRMESLADDPVVRSGMPPKVVEQAQVKANQAKAIFKAITHQSIEAIIASRPK